MEGEGEREVWLVRKKGRRVPGSKEVGVKSTWNCTCNARNTIMSYKCNSKK